MHDPSVVDQRLRQIRISRGLSQATLAARIGTSMIMIKHYERGREPIPDERLAMLAQALGCRTADLLAPLEAPLPRRLPRRWPVHMLR